MTPNGRLRPISGLTPIFEHELPRPQSRRRFPFAEALAVLVLALGVGVAVLWTGCAIPAVGTRCDAGAAYCSSKTAALTCQGGALVPYACSGPKGCTLGPGRAVLCDQSAGAAIGSSCFPEYAGKGQCLMDGTGLLQCLGGSWTAVACPQGTNCKDDGGVSCR